jgi:MerR family transcriptional regulator, copper efflux regulator
MNIGEAARESGISAKAIRYYERIGLVAPSGRTESGYRVYAPSEVAMLRFIKRARELGFSIERVRRLIDLWRDKNRASADVKWLALEHIHEIEAKIAELAAIRDAVRELAAACQDNTRPDCPILRNLEGLVANEGLWPERR